MTQASHGIAEFKAVDDGPQGLFAAKVSVYGNVDRNGDRMMPGAFDGTVGRWRASGKKIPVIWSHEHKDPDAYIGWVDPEQIRLTEAGVVVAGQLDIDDNPMARRAYNLLKNGLVTEWSFAYQVLQEKTGADGAREIYEVDLFEVGPTLIGANGMTDTLAVASAATNVSNTAPADITITYPPPNTTVVTSTSTVETLESKQVDNSAWDGSAAMAACDSAADFRSICAGERSTGEPDERQHWALPHHKRPGAAPNANGVRNALARLGQTQGLKNAGAARSHLESHMAQVRSEAASADDSRLGQAVDEAVAALDKELDTLIETKIGRVISRRTEEKIRAAVSQLNTILSSLDEEMVAEGSPSEEKAAEQAAPPSEDEQRRQNHRKLGLFLKERGR